MAGITVKMQAAGTRRDLQRSRDTRTSFWRVVIVSSFFVVVIGASLFLGAVMMIGTLRDQDGDLRADGRTTRIARALRDGALCHYVVIDNRTAQALEDRIGRCDENKPKAKPAPVPTFRWGGG